MRRPKDLRVVRRDGDDAAGSFPELDFRILTACREMSVNLGGPDLETLGVTSAGEGEGRTTLALGMALVHARDYRRRVVVLDLNVGLANASLADRLGGQRGPGVAECVTDTVPLGAIQQQLPNGITLVSAGRFTEATIGPTVTACRGGLLHRLREGHDVLIADLPPLLAPGLARLIAGEFQRLAMVVAAGRTPIPRLQEALSHLSVEPAFVLNGSHSKVPRWLQSLTGA